MPNPPVDWDPTKHYQNTSVATEYDRVRFSSLAGRVFVASERKIITQCFDDIPHDTVILDLPCGTGRLAEALLETGFRVHGADISAEMLGVAADRLVAFEDRFTYEVIDAFKVSNGPARFDCTLCARVLMHFPLDTQIQFMKGVSALTKNRVVINHSLSSPYQRFRRFIKRLLGHQPSARFPISDVEIKRLLSESGLIEIARYRINSLISEAVYIVAKKAS
jgi:2-polyprenyl-3-methyl-5-hydroxy-6-metoxy-1,4-benzoquinol methylase